MANRCNARWRDLRIILKLMALAEAAVPHRSSACLRWPSRGAESCE